MSSGFDINTIDRRFNIPWVGSDTTWVGGSKIPWVGGQNTIGREFDIQWVGDSIYHG